MAMMMLIIMMRMSFLGSVSENRPLLGLQRMRALHAPASAMSVTRKRISLDFHLVLARHHLLNIHVCLKSGYV